MVRLGIALTDRKNDQPLQSLCNFRSTAMFSLLLTFNLFTPQNTAFITASNDTYYSEYYSNDTDFNETYNDDTDFNETYNDDNDYNGYNNASYYGDCELGAGKGTSHHDDNSFISNHITTGDNPYEGEIYNINVEYNYEIFAKEEDDSIMTEIQTVETQLSLMLLPLLFPDECADTDTRSGGDTLDVIVGITSDPPDVVDDSGCVNADVEPVKNTFCIKISGALTVYSKSNDDNIKTLVGEELDTELRKVFKEAATFIEGRNIKKVDVKKKSIKITWTDDKKKSNETQWWKITLIVVGSSFLLITVVRVISKKLKERHLFDELTTTRNFKDQKNNRLSVTKLLHSIRKDRHTPRSDIYSTESVRFRDDPS